MDEKLESGYEIAKALMYHTGKAVPAMPNYRLEGYRDGLKRALELTFMQMAKGNYSFREGWIAALAELRTRIQEELDNGR